MRPRVTEITLSAMHSLSREQIRQMDRRAIEEFGIPGIVLMENAGRQVSDVVLDVINDELHLIPHDASIAVLCGGGNNGGDGYVIARHLANQQVKTTALAVVDPKKLSGDAAVHHGITAKMDLVVPAWTDIDLAERNSTFLTKAHVIVDGLLGTGFEGQVRPHIAAAIEMANAARARGARIVAVDVPSRLDCESGDPAEVVISADLTVTFVAPKLGFGNLNAESCLGEVIVAGIGAPLSLVAAVLEGK